MTEQTASRALATQVVYAYDTEGICTVSTGPGLALQGFRPGELVGADIFAMFGEARAATMRRALTGETFEDDRLTPDGRLLSLSFHPLRDPEGTITGGLVVATDVTELRRIEDAERAAKRRATVLGELAARLSEAAQDPDLLAEAVVRELASTFAGGAVLWTRSPDGTTAPRASWPAGTTSAPPTYDEAARPTAEALLDSGTRLHLPLHSRERVLGFVDLCRDEPFTLEEVSLAEEMAQRSALFVDNAMLHLAEREAREALVKFEAMVEASSDLTAISDVDGVITYRNPRVAAYGIDLVDDNVWATLEAYSGAEKVAEVRAAIEREGRWAGDLTLAVPGADVAAAAEAFVLIHPETGASLGIGWTAQDQSDIRSIAAALREANSDLKQFKSLVDASPDFIAIANLDGSVRYVNPPGRAMVGLDPDVDVTTTSIPDYLTPEGLVASLEIEQPAVVRDGHWEGESTLRNSRGPAIPVAIASFLVRDAETGEPFALATVQRDITAMRDAERALRELAEQRQALLTRLVDAQEDERAQIAADVHDDPVQACAAVELRLGLLRRRLEERAPDLVESLEVLQKSVSGAIDRLRALLFDLEPPDLGRGLAAALERAAGEIFEGTAVQWRVEGGEEADVPDATRAVGYRIAKEALINVRKHARAEHVAVSVRAARDGLEVVVTDDGVGSRDVVPGVEGTAGSVAEAGSRRGHRGLRTMADRAAVAGGTLTVTSPGRAGDHGAGTTVAAWLPAPAGSERPAGTAPEADQPPTSPV